MADDFGRFAQIDAFDTPTDAKERKLTRKIAATEWTANALRRCLTEWVQLFQLQLTMPAAIEIEGHQLTRHGEQLDKTAIGADHQPAVIG